MAESRRVIHVPGDRHISHTALFLAALSPQGGELRQISPARDVQITMRFLQQLGIPMEQREGCVRILPRPSRTLQEPRDILHVRNSYPTAALGLAFLAGHAVSAVMDGNATLKERDFRDLVRALSLMGAMIIGREHNRRLPLAVQGSTLQGMVYEQLSVDAYLKSAMILAGLNAYGETRIMEHVKSWDHMERLLFSLGLPLSLQGAQMTVQPSMVPSLELDIPGDITLAAPFLVVGALQDAPPLVIEGVHFNLTRTTFLRVLKRMQVQLEMEVFEGEGPEAVGRLTVHPSSLIGVTVREKETLLLEEELPLLVYLGTRSRGLTVIEGLSRLPYPALLRLQRTVDILRDHGAWITQTAYRLVIEGPSSLSMNRAPAAYRDPFLAMLWAVVWALEGRDPREVSGQMEIEQVFPGFLETLQTIQTGGMA